MRKVGAESRKTYQAKLDSGFFEKFCPGIGLDIGYSGYEDGVEPILETAFGIEPNTFKNYNGYDLPLLSESRNYIYASHCLEHVEDYKRIIKEWFRILAPKGYLIVVVPHRDLYEKRLTLPSFFNADHKRFYTAASLLKEFEDSLSINTYRIRHLRENDEGHVYSDPPDKHGNWLYEIELVIQKL